MSSNDDDSEKSGLLSESIKTVYQKDLHQDHVILRSRVDTDKIDHGDKVRISVEKIEEDSGERR